MHSFLSELTMQYFIYAMVNAIPTWLQKLKYRYLRSKNSYMKLNKIKNNWQHVQFKFFQNAKI